ncbi:MAG: hypothetical protein AB7F40_04110 [Victivallaceae bacterium]|nr:hypothetical protein [Victivallaceae bacterium]
MNRYFNGFPLAAVLVVGWCVFARISVCGGGPDGGQIAGNEREVMNRNTALLAANLLISELRDAFARREIGIDMYGEMLVNPSKYSSPSAASTLLEHDYAAALQAAYRGEAQKLLDDVRTRYEGAAGYLSPEFSAEALKLPTSYLQANVSNVFPALFKNARERVCAEQRLRIVGSSYPTESEVDTLSEAELVGKLESKLLTDWGAAIFEENRGFVRASVVTPLVKEAFAQREQQKRIVSDASISDAILPADYEAELREKLAAAIAARRSNPSERKVYDVFPSIIQEVPRRARELTVRKFISTFKDYVPKYTPMQISDIILATPGDYRSAAGGERQFYNLFRQKMVNDALAAFVKRVPEANQRELRSFLETNIPSSQDAENTIKAYFDHQVLGMFRKVREDVAKAQFKHYLPSLENGSWQPPEAELENNYHDRSLKYSAKWRSLIGQELAPEVAIFLFDETNDMAAVAMDGCFATALKAMDRQFELTRGSYKVLSGFVSKAQQDADYNCEAAIVEFLQMPAGEKLTRETIAKAYADKIAADWDRDRVTLLWPQGITRPPNYEQLFKPLFPLVAEEIERNARSLFSELEITRPEIYGSFRDDPDLKVINCNLELNMSSGAYTVAVSSPQNPLMRQLFTLPILTGVPVTDDSLDRFYREAIGFVCDLVSKTSKTELREKNLVQVFLRVHNGDIPYRFVARFREQLREELRKLPVSAEARFRVADELKPDRE